MIAAEKHYGVYSSYLMIDINLELDRIEKELADLIVLYLQENKIEVGQAQKLAAAFLALLPITDQKELLTKLKQLSENYVEVRELYLKELSQANELEKEEALTQMRNAIAQGNIEHAVNVAKAMTGGRK